VPEHSLDGNLIAANAEQPIARTHAQRTAFVGRTLRGPLNKPIIVRSFSDFQQIFGGLWQPSPLSYAVEQFFEQGGRQAVIVRVANGAQPVTISLPCRREQLKLEARAPGTREFLRASVDYDHIPADDVQRFNLVVQRVRSPGSGRVEEQEIFRALSVDPRAPREERRDDLALPGEVGLGHRVAAPHPPPCPARELLGRGGCAVHDAGDLVEGHREHVVQHEDQALGG